MTEQRRSKGHLDTGVRERLLLSTRQCVRERGLAHTSSRAITDRAGVNLAAITYYFGSKDDLVAAALAAELRDWLQPALDELQETDDPATRLLSAVSILSDRFDAERERVPGLLEAFVHAARDEHASAAIVEIWTEVRVQLRTTLEQLHSRDAIPSWVEPDGMAMLIVAVVAGTVVSETVDPLGSAHRDVASQFTRLLMSAGADRSS